MEKKGQLPLVAMASGGEGAQGKARLWRSGLERERGNERAKKKGLKVAIVGHEQSL